MGNCGVGFAPAAPDRHDWLIGLLEGVEDIPGTALAEGLTWDWETFPEYLDSLEAKPHTVDVAAHVPHAALRTYVMGERGADHTEAPTDDELDEMARQVREAIDGGAIGFATSRTEIHRTTAGQNIGTLTADERSCSRSPGAMADAGRRCHPADQRPLPDPRRRGRPAELDLLEAFVRTSGRPLQLHDAAGVPLARPVAVPDGLGRPHGRRRPRREGPGGAPARSACCSGCRPPPTRSCSARRMGELALPLARAASRRCATPSASAGSSPSTPSWPPRLEPGILRQIMCGFDVIFRLTDPVDYELDADWCVAAEAARAGREPADLVYDLLLERDGTQLLYLPLFNFAHGNLDDVHEMITAPNTLFGLSDAGAHCGAICDASMTTSSLTVWSRDRRRGERIPVEQHRARPHPAQRRPRGLARPRRGRARLPRRPQRDRPRPRSPATRRASCTTCPPAGAG